MSVRMIERKTAQGNRYYYIEENGKRIAQCRKRVDAKRVLDAMFKLGQAEEAFDLETALKRDATARKEASSQMATVQPPRPSGIVIAGRLP